MDKMFTNKDIDFDKLHGEIRENLERQRELRSQGVKYRKLGLYGYCQGKRADWEKAREHPHVKGRPEYELCYLSTRMTVLCSILNYAKGKHHFKTLEKAFSKHPIFYTDLPVQYTPEKLDKLHTMVFGDEWRQFLTEERTTPSPVQMKAAA